MRHLTVRCTKFPTQIFPPKPTLTSSNLPDQAGKVFIVTGGSSGIGFELARILYNAGGTVYIMTRTASSAEKAIEDIKSSTPASATTHGSLKFIHLDLADLFSVPASVAVFRAQENRLDVLLNNAGVASHPVEKKTRQGLEPHFGINCIGAFLLTKPLHPVLIVTASQTPANSVRIVWSSSVLVDIVALEGGVTIEQLAHPGNDPRTNYSSSKAGDFFLASEYHRCFQVLPRTRATCIPISGTLRREGTTGLFTSS